MTTPLTIEYVDSAHEARRWRDQGYCPIECAFGEESVVDALQMDHHGTMGDLEGVAVRACRDHYGARKADPRFVVAGAADADAHLTRKVNAFAGVCISVYLHCNSRNCSQPAKKFRGFPFFQLPISINSDLFRISDFGFRVSDFRLLPGCAKGPRFKDGAHRSPAKARSVAGPMPMPE